MQTINEINIKGMVCNRCISAIEEIFSTNGFPTSSVTLGKVVFKRQVDIVKKEQLKKMLSVIGFDLISDKNERMLASLKDAIDEWLCLDESTRGNRRLSDYLSEKFGKNYDSLSEFFSRYEGKTIERYFIGKRIEKVKELLVYADLPLSEIAFKTGYSSAHHLSSQFKKVTGFNPSELRAVREEKQKITSNRPEKTV